MDREALVVGINLYPFLKDGRTKKPRHLDKPAADAEAVAQILETYGRFRVRRLPEVYDDEGNSRVAAKPHPNQLVQVQTLQAAIAQLFNPPSQTVPDTALLFFAGHGLRKPKQEGDTEGFLATNDANPQKGILGVSLQWLRRLLQESPVRQQIVWLDCCHSGELLNFLEVDPGEVGNARDRCFISASRDFEVAYEEVGGQHGVLTGALLPGLKPEAESEGLGLVTNYSLVENINHHLPNSRQRPIFHNSGGKILLTGRKETIERAILMAEVCPYKGLESFEFNDQDPKYFYGRTALTDQLLAKVQQRNFLAVVGASGSGKSSLVKAGLLYQLKLGQRLSGSEQWAIRIFRPGEHPLESLALALVDQDASEPGQAELPASQGTAGLAKLVRAIDAPQVLLVVDQFEEVFTLCQQEKERQQFFDCLLEATSEDKTEDKGQKTEGGLGLRVVITMRADFFGKCAEQEYGGLASRIQENLVTVTPMTDKELEAAITEPAKQVGWEIERELVTQMLRDVEGPGTLPLLQYTLTELWREQRQMNLPFLTLANYNKMGGVKKTLPNRANEVYNYLDEGQKPIAKRIFLELTQLGEGTEDTRRQVFKQDFINDEQSKELVEKVISKLAEARLLVTSELRVRGENEATLTVVDVAHETLIHHWDYLRDWLTQNREAMRQERKFKQAARDWESQGKPKARAFLLEGRKLKEAESFQKDETRRWLLSSLAQEYIQVSRKAAWRRTQVGVVSSILVAGVAAVTVVFTQQLSEKNQRADQRTAARELATTAESIRSKQPGLYETSVLLAVESMQRFKNLEKPSIEADQALREGLTLLSPTVREISSVSAIAFSPDGQFLATASEDNTARILKVKTGKEVVPPIRHEDSVSAVAFSPDGQFLATASKDNTIRIWEIKTGKEVVPTIHHEDSVSAVAFSPDGQFLMTQSYFTACILEVKTGKEIACIRHESEVNAVVFSPNSQYLATASYDQTACILEVKTGKEVACIRHKDVVDAVAFSPDSQFLATASHDQTARIWEVRTGNEVDRINHKGWVTDVAFSPNGQYLATACRDYTARILEVNTEKDGVRINQAKVVRINHENPVITVAFSADNQFLATASEDNIARILEVKTGNEVARINHEGWVKSVIFSPDSTFLATASFNNTARISEVQAGKEVVHISHNGGVKAVAFSPDGQYLATASWDNTARISEVKTGNEVTRINQKGGIKAIAFSRDGQYLATASWREAVFDNHWNNTVRIWEVKTGEAIPLPISISQDSVTAVNFSGDAQYLATVSSDNTTHIWEVKTGKEVVSINHEGSVNAIAFSSDSQFLATASSDNTARIWEVKTGKEVVSINHEGSVNAIAFSSDSQFLATASSDNTARIWEVKTGKEFARINYEGSVNAIAFSSDSQFLATASSDNTARIWEVKTGKEFARINHEDSVNAVAFSPDDKFLATASDDTMAGVHWRDLITEACRRLSRNLTADEWITHIGQLEKYSQTCPDHPIHPSLLKEAKKLASQGEEKKALAIIRRAKTLDPDIDLNPDTEAIENDPKAVVHTFAAPGKVKEGEKLGREGKVKEAIKSYTQALKLDPDIDLNPDTEAIENDPKAVAHIFAAQGKVKDGERLAREGKVKEAIKSYTQALDFNPDIDLNSYTKEDKENDPQSVAHTFAASSKVEEGRTLAAEGKVKEAIASYTQALTFDPDIDLNTETTNKENDPTAVAHTIAELAAWGKVREGETLARKGQVQKAIASYNQAQKLDPTLEISANSWNSLCWLGSLHQQATQVMNACEKAVTLEPLHGGIQDSRGLARALTGDTAGAIEDFQAFIAWTDNDDHKAQRQRWINELRAGKNPFTKEELESLLNE